MALTVRPEDGDTICALSSAPGLGALAVVRASGPRAYEVARRLCPSLPEEIESHRAHVGTLLEIGSPREPIDEAVIVPFAEGRSFTAEQTVEFSVHGSPTIVAGLLRELIAAGCRMARPGEFTYRSFMNGRLDLVQAESVLALIESQSKEAARASFRQLKGLLSREFSVLEDGLVWLLARLEASIDFSAEGIEITPVHELLARVDELIARCRALLSSHDQGRILQDGLSVALIGPPNVGKSSLLNALLEEDRAIVTSEPGTTRDLVEGRLSLGGVVVRLVDTAGLRETANEAERIGIARSRAAAVEADVVLAVLDATADSADGPDVLDPNRRVDGILLNKWDLIEDSADGPASRDRVRRLRDLWLTARPGIWTLEVSARTGGGLSSVREALRTRALRQPLGSGAVVLQARHFEVLKRIEMGLNAARRLIAEEASPDFVAFELQEAVRCVHELLGKRFDEQVIDRIFKEFCLGK